MTYFASYFNNDKLFFYLSSLYVVEFYRNCDRKCVVDEMPSGNYNHISTIICGWIQFTNNQNYLVPRGLWHVSYIRVGLASLRRGFRPPQRSYLRTLKDFVSEKSGKLCKKSGKYWIKSRNREILRRFIFSCIRACHYLRWLCHSLNCLA